MYLIFPVSHYEIETSTDEETRLVVRNVTPSVASQETQSALFAAADLWKLKKPASNVTYYFTVGT